MGFAIKYLCLRKIFCPLFNGRKRTIEANLKVCFSERKCQIARAPEKETQGSDVIRFKKFFARDLKEFELGIRFYLTVLC